MAAIIIKWVVVVLAAMNFGYMAFDGGRALIKGDYIRPASGNYAGQLGPWTKLVSKVGIHPESNAMKTIFLLWGMAGLFITTCYAFNARGAAGWLLALNVLSLWYLFAGTISSGLQIILLLIKKSLG
jgi:hypothetical protein